MTKEKTEEEKKDDELLRYSSSVSESEQEFLGSMTNNTAENTDKAAGTAEGSAALSQATGNGCALAEGLYSFPEATVLPNGKTVPAGSYLRVANGKEFYVYPSDARIPTLAEEFENADYAKSYVSTGVKAQAADGTVETGDGTRYKLEADGTVIKEHQGESYRIGASDAKYNRILGEYVAASLNKCYKTNLRDAVKGLGKAWQVEFAGEGQDGHVKISYAGRPAATLEYDRKTDCYMTHFSRQYPDFNSSAGEIVAYFDPAQKYTLVLSEYAGGLWPVDHGQRRSAIVSDFGMRLHPINKTFSAHSGIDIADDSAGTCTGEPVIAAYRGLVTDVSYNDTYGVHITVEAVVNGKKTAMLYGHVQEDSPRVKVGDHINAGDVIANVGATGNVTGAHLHFGVKQDGKWIDPIKSGMIPAPSVYR